MAKIVLNEDVAPKDAKSFSLANENFEVPYETDDPVVLSNAAAHPWLKVERPKADIVGGVFRDPFPSREDDAFSGANSVANDPKAARAALAERDDLTVAPLAVDAGLDQDKAVTVGEGDREVAVTLAADDTSTTKTARKSSAAKED